MLVAFKRTSFLLLAAMAVSSGSMAGSAGDVCLPNKAEIPCESNRWDLHIEGLYLRAVDHAMENYVSYDSSMKTPWHWGYQLGGAFYGREGHDVSVDWLHYNNTGYGGTFAGQYLQLVPNVGLVSLPSSYAFNFRNEFNRVNAVFGQQASLASFKTLHFYSGLQYANIRAYDDLAYRVSGRAYLGTSGVGSHFEHDFYGVGPVLGIDMTYDISSSIALTANSSATVLYGSSRYESAQYYGNGLVVDANKLSYHTIVSSLEAKLGVNYTYRMNQADVILSGGYYAVNYFRPFISMSSLQQHDFGLYGPYIGAKWLGQA